MKIFKFVFLFIFAITLCACRSTGSSASSEPKEEKPDPIIAIKQKEKEKLSKQSTEQMLASRKIPTVDFEFDSVNLAPSAYPVLDKVAEIMRGNQKLKLVIEGHSDSVGGDEYNEWLSKARAMAVKSYIVSRGVYPDSITVYGYGNKRPLTMDSSPAGRATNRRVEFSLTERQWNAVF